MTRPPAVSPASLAAELARTSRELPGWHVWPVPRHYPPGIRWCGAPAGHRAGAVAWGETGGELIEHAASWADRQPGTRHLIPPAFRRRQEQGQEGEA